MNVSVSESAKAVALDLFYPNPKKGPRTLGSSGDSLGTATVRPYGNCSRAPSPTFNSAGVKAPFLFMPLLTNPIRSVLICTSRAEI